MRDFGMHYVLKGKIPVIEPDLLTYAMWFETSENRFLFQTKLPWCWISTVFLGIDHNFSFQGPPVLFETMVFSEGEDEMYRCCTWDQAEEMHTAVVKKTFSFRGFFNWVVRIFLSQVRDAMYELRHLTEDVG